MTMWQTHTIGEVCQVINGGTPKTGIPEYWGGRNLWVTPAEMGKRPSPYISTTERRITDLGLRNSSAEMLPPNSVILSSRAPIGHLVINTEPMATNQGCKSLIPDGRLHHKFLYYYLSNIVDLLNSLGTGATFKELSGGKLKEVTIPVPPMPEQKQIVAILDEAFDEIAAVKVSAEKNLQSAGAIFESHLQSVFAQREGGWIETTIGDQVVFQRGFDITKNKQTRGSVPVVSSGGIKSFHDTAMAKAPGVVIGRKGTLGKVFYLSESYWPHDTTLWIKDFKGNLPRFVYHFMRNLDVAHLDTGTANPALNRNVLHQIKINWPLVEMQTSLTDVFDQLEMNTERLASVYERKLAALDALKKSMLHNAFAGELTANKASELVEAVA
jgi:type I restriction enzyme, S subunit